MEPHLPSRETSLTRKITLVPALSFERMPQWDQSYMERIFEGGLYQTNDEALRLLKTGMLEKQPSNIGGSADFVCLTPLHLGFSERPLAPEVLGHLVQWSCARLNNYQLLQKCWPTDAAQLRLLYKDQPAGEILWIAMDPLWFPDRLGLCDGWIFALETDQRSDKWLFAYRARRRFSLDAKILFRLNKDVREQPESNGR